MIVESLHLHDDPIDLFRLSLKAHGEVGYTTQTPR